MVVGCSEICSLTVKIFPLSQQDLREPDLCDWVFVWMLGLAPKPPRTKAPAVQQVFKRQATRWVTRLGFWYVDSDLQIVSAGLKAAQKEQRAGFAPAGGLPCSSSPMDKSGLGRSANASSREAELLLDLLREPPGACGREEQSKPIACGREKG